MTLYSKADVRNEALRDLGALDLAESAAAELADHVDTKFLALLEELETENLVIFNSQSAEATQVVPGKVKNPLVELIKFDVSGALGLPKNPQEREYGLKRLRRAVLSGSSERPTVAVYY